MAVPMTATQAAKGFKLDVPFDYEINQYSCTVRLTYRDFRMEVSREAWERACYNPTMLKELTEHVMSEFYRFEKTRYSGMTIPKYGAEYGADMVLPAKTVPRPPEPKAAPKVPNKLLLLCRTH
jgi:hypothetical protein